MLKGWTVLGLGTGKAHADLAGSLSKTGPLPLPRRCETSTQLAMLLCTALAGLCTGERLDVLSCYPSYASTSPCFWPQAYLPSA